MSTIRKRTWKVGDIERTAWICDYADQAGKRHIKTFASKGEATRWSVEALHEVKRGTHTAASASITVAEAFARWIARGEAEGLERSTVRQRQQHLKLHIAPFVGAVKLSSLTLPRVHQFNDQLRDNNRSASMRRKVITNLGSAIGFAMDQGLVAQNVVRGFKMRKSDRDSGGPLRAGVDFPTKAELKAMLDTVPDRHRAFVAVLIFSGARASETRGLRWSDVDLVAGVVHVRQRADFWGQIGPPKSKAGSRDIPLVPVAANALRAWRLQCPKGDLDLVFPSRTGRVQRHDHLQRRVLNPLQHKCGIAKPYGFHAFRHAAASLMIEHLGWQPKQLQTVLGHSSIRMTYDLYGHLFASPEANAEAMRRLEAAVGMA
jgi:integrase